MDSNTDNPNLNEQPTPVPGSSDAPQVVQPTVSNLPEQPGGVQTTAPVPTIPPAPVNPVNPVNQFDSAPPTSVPGVPAQAAPPTMPSTDAANLPAANTVSSASPAAKPPRRKRKLAFIILAVIIIIIAAVAVVYAEVIVPNEPANVLKTAFLNTIQQTSGSTTGTFQAKSGSYKGTFSAKGSTAAKTADVQLNLTAAGVNFPIEARLVNQNAYVKIGDLSTVADLLNTAHPVLGSIATTLNSQFSNKWIAFDSTLIDQSSSLKCVLNTNWTFTKSDVTNLENQYNKYPFITIESTSNATVNNVATEKFVVSMNDEQASKLNLNDLSVIKAFNACGSGTLTFPPDHGTQQLIIWVEKSSKLIVKASAPVTAAIKSGTRWSTSKVGSITVNMHYGPVSVQAPAQSTPALQVLTQIENDAQSNPTLQTLLNSGASTTPIGPNALQD